MGSKWKEEVERAKQEQSRSEAARHLEQKQLDREQAVGRPARKAEVAGTLEDLGEAAGAVYDAEKKHFKAKGKKDSRAGILTGNRRLYVGVRYSGDDEDGRRVTIEEGKMLVPFPQGIGGPRVQDLDLDRAAQKYVHEGVAPRGCSNWDEFATLTLRALAKRLLNPFWSV